MNRDYDTDRLVKGVFLKGVMDIDFLVEALAYFNIPAFDYNSNFRNPADIIKDLRVAMRGCFSFTKLRLMDDIIQSLYYLSIEDPKTEESLDEDELDSFLKTFKIT